MDFILGLSRPSRAIRSLEVWVGALASSQKPGQSWQWTWKGCQDSSQELCTLSCPLFSLERCVEATEDQRFA
jgi:hypothetical protein